jgi:itaconate CoA-transferase
VSLRRGRWLRILDYAKIASARVNEMRDLWNHAQLQARQRWTEVSSPVGEIRALLPPGLSEAPMDEVPALGEHTRAILTELGYDSETIDLLVTEKAI